MYIVIDSRYTGVKVIVKLWAKHIEVIVSMSRKWNDICIVTKPKG